jgi:hypothetical protein
VGVIQASMFSYFGSKWRIARKYPRPRYGTIIEPFAGSACYALHYPHKRVLLYDLNEKVCGVWEYLIRATKEEILALPLEITDLRETDLCQEARWLIGFWIGKASAHPRNTASGWFADKGRDKGKVWGRVVRSRIARNVRHVRHWKIFHASYDTAPDVRATWFVDPPYTEAGKWYKHHDIDYAELGRWCRSRKGQVIACEGPEADWLPFRPMLLNQSAGGAKFKREMVWHKSDVKAGLGFF